MVEAKNQRLGVVGVLTQGSDYLLTPLGMSDMATDPLRKERIGVSTDSVGIQADWFPLKAETLGFPGGAVELPVDAGATTAEFLQQETGREIGEELNLELAKEQLQGQMVEVGVIEQLRHGELAAFLVYALLKIDLTDEQAQTLIQQGAIRISQAELEKHIDTVEFKANVRPASLLVIRQALLGLEQTEPKILS